MLLKLILMLASLDVALLGSDSFDARQAAHKRLEKMDFLAYPSLVIAKHSPDVEIRHRAARIAESLEERIEPVVTTAMAWYFFHGPREHNDKNYRHFLHEKKLGGYLAKRCISDYWMCRLIIKAREWKYLGAGEVTYFEADIVRRPNDDGRWCWMNVVRHRAAGDKRF